MLDNIYKKTFYKILTRHAQKPFDDEHGFEDRLKEEGYFSQCGQDKWIVEKIFFGKRLGVFVDIGANDGVSLSNTLYLERNLDWTGLAVEPIPHIYEKLKRNRLCHTVQGCVGPRNGKELFRIISGYSEMLSGLISEYDLKHLERIEMELAKHGGTYQELEVWCYNFNDLLENYNLHHVDYLSIDAEGAEYSILKGIDFNRFKISLIGVENNYKDFKIPKLLKENGFRLHSIVGDEFYLSDT